MTGMRLGEARNKRAPICTFEPVQEVAPQDAFTLTPLPGNHEDATGPLRPLGRQKTAKRAIRRRLGMPVQVKARREADLAPPYPPLTLAVRWPRRRDRTAVSRRPGRRARTAGCRLARIGLLTFGPWPGRWGAIDVRHGWGRWRRRHDGADRPRDPSPGPALFRREVTTAHARYLGAMDASGKPVGRS